MARHKVSESRARLRALDNIRGNNVFSDSGNASNANYVRRLCVIVSLHESKFYPPSQHDSTNATASLHYSRAMMSTLTPGSML